MESGYLDWFRTIYVLETMKKWNNIVGVLLATTTKTGSERLKNYNEQPVQPDLDWFDLSWLKETYGSLKPISFEDNARLALKNPHRGRSRTDLNAFDLFAIFVSLSQIFRQVIVRDIWDLTMQTKTLYNR